MDFDIIQKDSVPVCPVDASGCFTAEVTDFAGQYVKVSGLGESKLLLDSSLILWLVEVSLISLSGFVSSVSLVARKMKICVMKICFI